MNTPQNAQPALLPGAVTRLFKAWNDHSPAALAAVLHVDYVSVHPLHPERNSSGRDRAVMAWQAQFMAVPDLRADVVGWAQLGSEVWTEIRWSGTHVLGQPFRAAGVLIFEIAGEQVAGARVFSEILRPIGPDWDAVLDEILSKPAFD